MSFAARSHSLGSDVTVARPRVCMALRPRRVAGHRVSLLQTLGIVQLFAVDGHVVTLILRVIKPLQLRRSL